MRYYQSEHEKVYRKILERGLNQWNDAFDDGSTWTYDNFQSRAFLERTLPTIDLPPPDQTRVFEYGCGTGPASNYLAGLGFRVDAIDLIPDAIAIAEQMSERLGTKVNWRVGDICSPDLTLVLAAFDIVLDTFCLQSIVTDEDRNHVYRAVRSALKPNGYYIISTAMASPDRVFSERDHFDPQTGILYVATDDETDANIQIDGRKYAPHRRHLTPVQLRAELIDAGFVINSFACNSHAEVVCQLADQDSGQGRDLCG